VIRLLSTPLTAALAACVLALAVGATAHAEAPGAVSRGAWGAAKPNTGKMRPQRPSAIVIHMTGVRMQRGVSLENKMRGLQSYSQRNKGWGDVPYHYYISATGRLAKGRDIGYAGDTNTRYQTANKIQIVVEGEFDSEKPTSAQVVTLKKLTGWLARRYNVPASKVTAHNDHASTTCPGKNLKRILPELKALARKG
jgi:hypothetical protein